jgi:hypothetical protein
MHETTVHIDAAGLSTLSSTVIQLDIRHAACRAPRCVLLQASVRGAPGTKCQTEPPAPHYVYQQRTPECYPHLQADVL